MPEKKTISGMKLVCRASRHTSFAHAQLRSRDPVIPCPQGGSPGADNTLARRPDSVVQGRGGMGSRDHKIATRFDPSLTEPMISDHGIAQSQLANRNGTRAESRLAIRNSIGSQNRGSTTHQPEHESTALSTCDIRSRNHKL